MTQDTMQRLRDHGVQLAQVSAHHAADFCLYFGQNVIVSIGPEPHPASPRSAPSDAARRSTRVVFTS